MIPSSCPITTRLCYLISLPCLDAFLHVLLPCVISWTGCTPAFNVPTRALVIDATAVTASRPVTTFMGENRAFGRCSGESDECQSLARHSEATVNQHCGAACWPMTRTMPEHEAYDDPRCAQCTTLCAGSTASCARASFVRPLQSQMGQAGVGQAGASGQRMVVPQSRASLSRDVDQKRRCGPAHSESPLAMQQRPTTLSLGVWLTQEDSRRCGYRRSSTLSAVKENFIAGAWAHNGGIVEGGSIIKRNGSLARRRYGGMLRGGTGTRGFPGPLAAPGRRPQEASRLSGLSACSRRHTR